MKSRKPWLSFVAAGSLLFTGSLLAQNPPPPPAPPPPPPASMPPVPPPAPVPPSSEMPSPAEAVPAAPTAPTAPAAPAAPTADQASYQTSQGELTVRSTPAPAPQIGPAPDFAQLSAGGKGITEAQAVAYPPLANDFLHADSNRNGSISKAEYQRWARQP
ncbi:hypothetical protein UU9_00959 [Rhodanobacter fulvus Jip2]|uniref:EF-hand domain-containing protein n=1 Tax=Rhodanobacter fulvus Jip2 TaxID=1163408 RepID=I4VZZ1_9GAMM|nr:hypothetical protein [Rhodanobacter fulvus]EIL92782.1 hypothetical protein UU9_00959 [Rhodanobacter fulvus Jip2]